ncbi:MAG: hypothetical protein Q4A78_11975 [Peptostreptococcaceae bacterium]|nr:hypothetical protein [Peptostreptococcaceae bacterium]
MEEIKQLRQELKKALLDQVQILAQINMKLCAEMKILSSEEVIRAILLRKDSQMMFHHLSSHIEKESEQIRKNSGTIQGLVLDVLDIESNEEV